MLYILWGEDDFSLNEKLQEIKNRLGDISLLSMNTGVLEGQKLTVNELRAAGQAVPFLAERRLVIIKGLLERFEPKDKSGRPKKTNGTKKDESSIYDELVECIKGFPKSTVVVLTDIIDVKNDSLKNNALFNIISPIAEIFPFLSLKGTRLSQWVQSRVTHYGGSISVQGTNVLTGLIGGDLHTMNNEICKLVAFTAGRMIEEKDIRMVVSAAQEADIFAMVDSIMDHSAAPAEQVLQKLLHNGVVPQQILALLARQIQILVLLRELKSQKRPMAEIQSKTGLFSSYAWSKMSIRADKYSFERLKEIYRRLLETDLAVKTGRFDGDLALDVLVAELSQK